MILRIKYTCTDGSRTRARWPSMALLHWLMRMQPRIPIENPEPFKLYVVGPPVPGDTDPVFLTLIYAAIERRWNKTPPFEVIPPTDEDDYGGAAYQARCLDVLEWLHQEGDITTLSVCRDEE
jgi:hypothetical protein